MRLVASWAVLVWAIFFVLFRVSLVVQYGHFLVFWLVLASRNCLQL